MFGSEMQIDRLTALVKPAMLRTGREEIRSGVFAAEAGGSSVRTDDDWSGGGSAALVGGVGA